MSQFLQQLFSVPILVGESNNDEACDLVTKLAYKFRDEAGESGLVSDGWSEGAHSSERSDFDKYGVTSFYSKNLVQEEEWLPVAEFIHYFASTMIADVYDGDDMGIRNMWTTIYPQEAYVPHHIHDNTLMSGCFYANAAPDCGDIVFQDPSWVAKTSSQRIGGGFPNVPTRFKLPVKKGMMVLFPGWLPHETLPNRSGEDRIIVSFNLVFGVKRDQ